MRRLMLIALFTLVTLFITLPPTSVFAQTNPMCLAKITDEMGVFDDTTQLQQAIVQLDRRGAQVKVYALDTDVPLNDWQEQMVDNCPGWRNSSGQMADHLIIVAITSGRDAAIYYGDQWRTAIDPVVEPILDRRLIPHLQEEKFVEGFTDTLKYLDRAITVGLQPNDVEQAQFTQPSAALNVVALLMPLVLCASVLIFGIILLAILNAISNTINRNGQRRAAQRGAKLAHDEFNEKYTTFKRQLDSLSVSAKTTALLVADEDSTRLIELVERARTGYQNISNVLTDSNLPTTNPNEDNLEVNAYINIQLFYENCLTTLSSAIEALTTAQQFVSLIDILLQDIPSELDTAEHLLVTSRAVVNTAADKGFFVESLLAQLEHAEAQLKTSRTIWQETRKPVTAVDTLIDTIHETVKATATLANSLPTHRAQLIQQHEQLLVDIQAADALLDRGKAEFDQMDDNHPEETWSDLAGNGTEGEKRLKLAEELAEDIETALSMENQQWDEAAKMLQEAQGWLAEIEDLMESITIRARNLQHARATAHLEIRDAQQDINTASTFLKQATFDPGTLYHQSTALTDADLTLSRAREELQRQLPNYLRVVELAKNANKAADSILLAAQAAEETIQRLRRRAASALQSATQAIAQAEAYFKIHTSDIGMAAHQHLQTAKKLLQQAQSATQLEIQLSTAEQAEASATAAHSNAQQDFRNTQARRNPPVDYTSDTTSTASDPFGSWGSRPTDRTTTRQSPRPTPSRSSSSSSGSSWGNMGGGGGSYGGSGGGGSYGGRSSGGSFTNSSSSSRSSSSSSSRSSSSRSSSMSSSRRSGGGSKKW